MRATKRGANARELRARAQRGADVCAPHLVDPELGPDRVGLRDRVRERRERPRARVRAPVEREVGVERLEPQHGPLRPRVGGPHQAEVRAADRAAESSREAHEDDLVPRVAQQRQQALRLDVEAVRRAADLGRPEVVELARRALARRHPAERRTVRQRERLRPRARECAAL